MLNAKMFALEIVKVKVTEYNLRNGPIRWQVSTSIKIILEHFSLALTSTRYSHFKVHNLEDVGQSHDGTTFAAARFDCKHPTST